jgi:hypothetical protein
MVPPPSASPIIAALQSPKRDSSNDGGLSLTPRGEEKKRGEGKDAEEGEPPRREESIFSLLHNVRPMTAMVRVDSKTDEVQLFSPGGDGGGGGPADIWVAGNSDDDDDDDQNNNGSFENSGGVGDSYDFAAPTALHRSLGGGDDGREHFSSRDREEEAWNEINDAATAAVRLLPVPRTPTNNQRQQQPSEQQQQSECWSPVASPSSPWKAVSSVPSGPRKTKRFDVVAQSDMVRGASSSSGFGHPEHPPLHALTGDRSEFWLSTGLFPQVLTVHFEHDVQLEGVTLEAQGAREVVVLLDNHRAAGAGAGAGAGGLGGRALEGASTNRRQATTEQQQQQQQQQPTLRFTSAGHSSFEEQHCDLSELHVGACEKVRLLIYGAADFVAVRTCEIKGRPLISP